MNLLACDIGGTKTLLGIYTFTNSIKRLHYKLYKSNEWVEFNLIIKNFLHTLPKDVKHPEYACIGVAGQVINGIVKVTNLNWTIKENDIKQNFNLKDTILINDFSVLIYGIPFISKSQYISIQSGTNNQIKQDQYFSVIGAGTGLGIARGLITKQGIYSLPSEGGHREFSPRTDQEWELSKWIKKELGVNRVSIERVVSGIGLANIARWRLTKQDAKEHPLNKIKDSLQSNPCIGLAELVTEYAQKGDPIMTEVLELWLSSYGSAVGDLALQELCTSGLWIAGGIAAKNLDSIKSITFINSLKAKGRFTSFIESIPINVLIDPEFGLFSSACKAHSLSKYTNSFS